VRIRDRVKELRRVRAGDLRPSPANWRTHPPAQRDALKGLLAEVGFAGAALARELPDGTLELIDGHLRAETLPDQEIPVLVLDVDQAEARKLLASVDPLAAMAEADTARLDALLREVDTGSEGLQTMLARLAHDAGVTPPDFAPVGVDEQGRLDEKKKVTCPQCGHSFTP
jgi:ParB-like chromosome segregation protein Spo0J